MYETLAENFKSDGVSPSVIDSTARDELLGIRGNAAINLSRVIKSP